MPCKVIKVAYRTYEFEGYGTIRLPNYLYVTIKNGEFQSLYVQATRLGVACAYFYGSPDDALNKALDYMELHDVGLRFKYRLQTKKPGRAIHDVTSPAGVFVGDGYLRLSVGKSKCMYFGSVTPEKLEEVKAKRAALVAENNSSVDRACIRFVI